MLTVTRTGAHSVYGQRVTRKGGQETVAYVGRDADGNWAVKPADSRIGGGRVMIGRKTRKEALQHFEDALLAADEQDARMAANDAAYAQDQSEAAAAQEHRTAVLEEARADLQAYADLLHDEALLEDLQRSEAAHLQALRNVAHEEALIMDLEAEEAEAHEDPEVQALLRKIFGQDPALRPQRPVRDLDWSDVEADGERAAEAVAPPERLAAEALRPGMRVTLVSPDAARQGTIIGVRDGMIRFHDAETGYAERDAEWWAVYPRLTAEEATLAIILERSIPEPVEALTYEEMYAALTMPV
jgi:hypothetical protein